MSDKEKDAATRLARVFRGESPLTVYNDHNDVEGWDRVRCEMEWDRLNATELVVRLTDTTPLTRGHLLANGFVFVDGAASTYRHPSGLAVSIPTVPQLDDHDKEPWHWGIGDSWRLVPPRLAPRTVGALHHLLALATQVQTGVQTERAAKRKPKEL